MQAEHSSQAKRIIAREICSSVGSGYNVQSRVSMKQKRAWQSTSRDSQSAHASMRRKDAIKHANGHKQCVHLHTHNNAKGQANTGFKIQNLPGGIEKQDP